MDFKKRIDTAHGPGWGKFFNGMGEIFREHPFLITWNIVIFVGGIMLLFYHLGLGYLPDFSVMDLTGTFVAATIAGLLTMSILVVSIIFPASGLLLIESATVKEAGEPNDKKQIESTSRNQRLRLFSEKTLGRLLLMVWLFWAIIVVGAMSSFHNKWMFTAMAAWLCLLITYPNMADISAWWKAWLEKPSSKNPAITKGERIEDFLERFVFKRRVAAATIVIAAIVEYNCVGYLKDYRITLFGLVAFALTYVKMNFLYKMMICFFHIPYFLLFRHWRSWFMPLALTALMFVGCLLISMLMVGSVPEEMQWPLLAAITAVFLFVNWMAYFLGGKLWHIIAVATIGVLADLSVMTQNISVFPEGVIRLLGIGDIQAETITLKADQCHAFLNHGGVCPTDQRDGGFTLQHANILSRIGSSLMVEIVFSQKKPRMMRFAPSDPNAGTAIPRLSGIYLPNDPPLGQCSEKLLLALHSRTDIMVRFNNSDPVCVKMLIPKEKIMNMQLDGLRRYLSGPTNFSFEKTTTPLYWEN